MAPPKFQCWFLYVSELLKKIVQKIPKFFMVINFTYPNRSKKMNKPKTDSTENHEKYVIFYFRFIEEMV